MTVSTASAESFYFLLPTLYFLLSTFYFLLSTLYRERSEP